MGKTGVKALIDDSVSYCPVSHRQECGERALWRAGLKIKALTQVDECLSSPPCVKILYLYLYRLWLGANHPGNARKWQWVSYLLIFKFDKNNMWRYHFRLDKLCIENSAYPNFLSQGSITTLCEVRYSRTIFVSWSSTPKNLPFRDTIFTRSPRSTSWYTDTMTWLSLPKV